MRGQRRDLVLGIVGEYHRAMSEFARHGNLEMWYLHSDVEAIQARWGMTPKPKDLEIFGGDLLSAPITGTTCVPSRS